jgi:RNA polymerase sigma-70 factor (ECF subfamily)
MRSDNQQQERFYELLEPELPRLQGFCQKLVGDPELGNDLVQDALYSAWKNFGSLREAAAFRSWLYRIVINRYRTNRRRFGKRTNQTVSLTDDIIDHNGAQMQAVRYRLRIAMASLSASDRALVTLHELEGWSYSELAEMFGDREGTLRTKLTRCRDRMREALHRHFEETGEYRQLIGEEKDALS